MQNICVIVWKNHYGDIDRNIYTQFIKVNCPKCWICSFLRCPGTQVIVRSFKIVPHGMMRAFFGTINTGSPPLSQLSWQYCPRFEECIVFLETIPYIISFKLHVNLNEHSTLPPLHIWLEEWTTLCSYFRGGKNSPWLLRISEPTNRNPRNVLYKLYFCFNNTLKIYLVN